MGTPKLLRGIFNPNTLAIARVKSENVGATEVLDKLDTPKLLRGMNVMMGNFGGLISTWSFLPGGGPNYPIGNGLNLGTSTTILITAILLWVWMKRDNVKRDQRNVEQELAGLSHKQIEDLDWRHPAFRWKP